MFIMRVLVLAALIVGLVQASAGAADCKSAMTTRDMVQCMQDELATREAELSALVTKIEERLTANQLILLKASQHAWESFRFSNCSSARSLNDEGTMAPLTFVGCMVAMTEWRTTDLKEVYGSVLNGSK